MFVDILFQIIINPIYILIEFLYNFFLKFCHLNQIFSIMALSITVNFLWLPLYLNADKLKNEVDEIQKKLKEKSDTIKKNFKGEERHMLLATYYKQNNYHPVHSLKGTLSLLLQMVFFVAAYLFFVKNIDSTPDGLINFGNLKINILPVVMTIISIFSGLIYSKDHKDKKLQLFILPLLFLILLYNAPSALVLYWTVNNIFSLIKNIILNSKIKTPFYISGIKNTVKNFFEKYNLEKSKNTYSCYFLSCICLWLLVGLLAPWNVVASAPVKFFHIYPYTTPFPILFYNLLKTSGIFLFWGWVIFTFTKEKQKNTLAFFAVILFYFLLINYITIEYPYGEVTNALEFTNYIGSKILPFYCYLTTIFTTALLIFLFFKKRELIKKSLIIFILVSFSIAFYDAYEIIKMGEKIPSQNTSFEPFYNFSKNNKNVLILFIDKAIGNYLPVIFKEDATLKEYFEGFTYYPNIISFATFTRLAYPAMIGGYEYTPLNLDMDRTRPMKEKYNEALLMLPKLFQNNGFEVTVTDSPWGDFEYITPRSLFLKEGIKYDNLQGKYSNMYKKLYSYSEDKSALLALSRNLLYFSFMKTAPVSLRDFIIDKNCYLNLKKEEIKYTNDLLASYSLLYFLPKLTRFNAKKPTFTIINNELAHNADCFLHYNDYKLTFNPVPKGPLKINRYSQIHYHSNAASIRLICQYLKFLKENGIYDNTRIIIISDHGAKNLQNPTLDKSIEENVVRFNPLLLIKDFNQKGTIKTSNEFMTNADLSYLATNKIIPNPTNPFTNKEIKQDKDSALVMVLRTRRFRLRDKSNTPFEKKTECVIVKDNIFKEDNWTKLKRKDLKKLIKANRKKDDYNQQNQNKNIR